MTTEQIDALEHIRLKKRQEWETNSRDQLRVYLLQDADGNRQGERRIMNRSLAETENQLRAERFKRHEAIVSSARERMAAKQQAANEAWKAENKRRSLLGMAAAEAPEPIATNLSGIEQAALDYVQENRGVLWVLAL